MTALAANFKAADQNPAITRRVTGLHAHRLKSQYYHCVMVLIVESVVYMSDVCKWQREEKKMLFFFFFITKHDTPRNTIQFFNSNPCIVCQSGLQFFSFSLFLKLLIRSVPHECYRAFLICLGAVCPVASRNAECQQCGLEKAGGNS